MRKTRIILLFASILVIISGAGGWYFWKIGRGSSEMSQLSSREATTASSMKLITWDDQAGFILQYPQDLIVNKHDEDLDNYAHLEFSHKDRPGGLIVWAKDTNASDVTAWVRTERAFGGASVLDTDLGDQPAKKILLASEPKKIVVGTIYDELLFMVETTLGTGDYWTKTHDAIVGSFTFKPVDFDSGQTSVSGNDTSGEEVVDEEEVVE